VACFAASVAGRKLKQRDVMNAKHLSLVMNERNARRRLAEIAVLPCKDKVIKQLFAWKYGFALTSALFSAKKHVLQQHLL
jgi:hypothetical protein